MRRLLRNFAAAITAHWRVGVLVLAVAGVWCAHYDRWTLASWSVPTLYGGDALEIYARIAAAAEGDAPPLRPQVISRLGAPHGANWNAYPSSDIVLLWCIGRLARVVGVFAAANIALLLANITSALAFYGCARWLRARAEWALAGALLFAFTLQTFQRGIAHLFLIYSWTVPLAIVACAFIAHSRRLGPRGARAVFCVATGAAIGMGNPYVLFLFLQLLGWSLIVQWLGSKRRENLIVGGATLVVTIAVFAAVESHLWAFGQDSGGASPLVRSYAGTEVYAMKPVELLVPPPGHRWPALANLGFRYLDWSELRNGESSMSYLGVVGIAGLAWLTLASLRALIQRQRVPGATLPAAWILGFSSLGGITNVFALLTGLVVFRATNRFSIFISAIVLLFLATRLTRWFACRRPWLSGCAAAAVVAIGLADQLPRGPGLEWQREIAQRVAADRELGERIERELPQGAMVFQFPVIEFPEASTPHRLEDYAYFRPYLMTHSVCFSYGALKRRSRSHWQRELAGLTTPELVQRLERYGFAALYFHRDAFPDRGARLLRELDAAGQGRVLRDTGDTQVVVLLEPAEQPDRPLARRLTFGRGWHGSQPGEPRWAYGRAALSYFNPFPRLLARELRLAITGPDARTVCIRVNDTEVRRVAVDGSRQEVRIGVALSPGVNRIELESEQPAIRLAEARHQLRAFGLYDAVVSTEPSFVEARTAQLGRP